MIVRLLARSVGALMAFMAVSAFAVPEETAYLAPVNQLIFRMVEPGGVIREFERDFSRPGMLRGADGWQGEISPSGVIELYSVDRRQQYKFDRGRLISSEENGRKKVYSYNDPRVAPSGSVPGQYIPKDRLQAAAKEYSYRQFLHKWDGTGRLAFPFVNPNQNGALYGELLVLFVWLAVFLHKPAARIAAGVLAAAAAGCLFWTMSRGAWIGTALALVPLSKFKFKTLLRSRFLWTFVVIVVLATMLWIFLMGAGQIVRGFEAGGWTNAIRLEIWRNAPKMMFDAPGGWNFFQVGAAYLHWYQPLHVFALTPTLINDHLTWLAGWSWAGRFGYLFAVYAGLTISTFAWIRNRIAVSLALWTVLLVAAWFNPVMHRFQLWILPLAGFVPSLLLFPWRKLRTLSSVAALSAVLSALTVGGLYFSGRSASSDANLVRADSAMRRVMYNGPNPMIWIVDDGMLGGGLAGKDIREFYSVERKAPAIGYVTDISALPRNVEKLVLSGAAGSDWLTKLSENPSARESLPKTVVFLSPPFASCDIPEGVRKMCRVKVLTGEFSALYDSRLNEKVEGVTAEIVPGMEQYVLQWMWRVMGY